MQIIILTVSMLLATCVTSVIKSAQEGAGQHRLHRRMNALPSPELDDLSLKGWNYLSLMFLPAETTGRIIQEWIAEGKEPGGSNGHRQRDWLTETDFASIPGWTFSPCADEEHSLQSIFDALVNVLPKGESAQPRTRKPDRVNVGLMAPEGPNRCFVWKQDERYTSVSGQINMPPTGAAFKSVYNVRDGFALIQDIFTPENGREWHYHRGERDRQTPSAQQISQEMPQIKDWEDLVFVTWEQAKKMTAREGRRPEHVAPRWFVQQDYWGSDQSPRIVKTCLEQRGYYGPIPSFPGQIFFMGSRCYNALLQTEQSKRLMWLLTLHKERWGCMVLTSVRVFLGSRPNDGLPSLIWEAELSSPGLEHQAGAELHKARGGPRVDLAELFGAGSVAPGAVGA